MIFACIYILGFHKYFVIHISSSLRSAQTLKCSGVFLFSQQSILQLFYLSSTSQPKKIYIPFFLSAIFVVSVKRDELFRILHFTFILWTPFEQVDHSYLLILSVQISLLRSFSFLEFANIILWMSVDLFVCNWYFLDLVNTLFDYDNFFFSPNFSYLFSLRLSAGALIFSLFAICQSF